MYLVLTQLIYEALGSYRSPSFDHASYLVPLGVTTHYGVY